MKRLIKSLRTGHLLSHQALPLIIFLFLLPSLVLMGFGLVAIYQLGYMLHFVVLLTLISSLYFAMMLVVKNRLKTHTAATEKTLTSEGLVNANPDWSDFDHNVWIELNDTMDSLLKEQDSWEVLREHALAVISTTANHYRPNKTDGQLAFTLPELLAMTEEVSRRYRQIVLEHLPFAEQIHLSRLKQLYQYRDKTDQIEYIWNAYRAYRLFTPTGIISEIRSQISGHLLDEVKTELKISLKKAFLQEVASVAIDLYSGRFQQTEPVQNEEMSDDDLPPLRVCLIGQKNAGKSTLANCLIDEIRAEVSVLPSTNQKHIYRLDVDGQTLLHVIDLPGLDPSTETHQLLMEEAKQADLIFWLLRANQPARSLDIEFKKKLDALYQQTDMRSRKRPPLIGVLTQVDKLSTLEDWQPTDLPLQEALEYNKTLIQMDTLIPLSITANKAPWGLENVLSELDQRYQDARQTQLNRLRLDSNQPVSIKKEFKRVYRIGTSLFQRWRSTQ